MFDTPKPSRKTLSHAFSGLSASVVASKEGASSGGGGGAGSVRVVSAEQTASEQSADVLHRHGDRLLALQALQASVARPRHRVAELCATWFGFQRPEALVDRAASVAGLAPAGSPPVLMVTSEDLACMDATSSSTTVSYAQALDGQAARLLSLTRRVPCVSDSAHSVSITFLSSLGTHLHRRLGALPLIVGVEPGDDGEEEEEDDEEVEEVESEDESVGSLVSAGAEDGGAATTPHPARDLSSRRRWVYVAPAGSTAADGVRPVHLVILEVDATGLDRTVTETAGLMAKMASSGAPLADPVEHEPSLSFEIPEPRRLTLPERSTSSTLSSSPAIHAGGGVAGAGGGGVGGVDAGPKGGTRSPRATTLPLSLLGRGSSEGAAESPPTLSFLSTASDKPTGTATEDAGGACESSAGLVQCHVRVIPIPWAEIDAIHEAVDRRRRLSAASWPRADSPAGGSRAAGEYLDGRPLSEGAAPGDEQGGDDGVKGSGAAAAVGAADQRSGGNEGAGGEGARGGGLGAGGRQDAAVLASSGFGALEWATLGSCSWADGTGDGFGGGAGLGAAGMRLEPRFDVLAEVIKGGVGAGVSDHGRRGDIPPSAPPPAPYPPSSRADQGRWLRLGRARGRPLDLQPGRKRRPAPGRGQGGRGATRFRRRRRRCRSRAQLPRCGHGRPGSRRPAAPPPWSRVGAFAVARAAAAAPAAVAAAAQFVAAFAATVRQGGGWCVGTPLPPAAASWSRHLALAHACAGDRALDDGRGGGG